MDEKMRQNLQRGPSETTPERDIPDIDRPINPIPLEPSNSHWCCSGCKMFKSKMGKIEDKMIKLGTRVGEIKQTLRKSVNRACQLNGEQKEYNTEQIADSAQNTLTDLDENAGISFKELPKHKCETCKQLLLSCLRHKRHVSEIYKDLADMEDDSATVLYHLNDFKIPKRKR